MKLQSSCSIQVFHKLEYRCIFLLFLIIYLIPDIHLLQNSVNAKYQTIPYPWLVFGEKIKVNTVFIRDSTGVSDSILLLFGGNLLKGEMVTSIWVFICVTS